VFYALATDLRFAFLSCSRWVPVLVLSIVQ
jgi:hypothetical protein